MSYVQLTVIIIDTYMYFPKLSYMYIPSEYDITYSSTY